MHVGLPVSGAVEFEAMLKGSGQEAGIIREIPAVRLFARSFDRL